MRYALISDLHANRQAWTAVDKDIRNHGADSVLCLGDIIGYGPDPVAVLDACYERCAGTVIGNHDAVVGGSLDRELFNDNARRLIDWTCKQLGDDAADYFAGLPYKMSDDNMLCVHAEAAAPARFGYIIDVLKAYESFEAVDEKIIFAGHTHVPGVFVQSPTGAVAWQGPGDFKLLPDHRYLVNVGSVGDPRDNSPRASYCLYDVESQDIMFRRVSFDYAGYRSAIEKAALKTTPHCLSLLEKGVSVEPPQPLRDMAIKAKAASAPPAPKEARSQQTVDLKTAQQKSKKRRKRKFGGAPRRRISGATSATDLKAISGTRTAVAAPAQPPPKKKLSGNAKTWVAVGAIAACLLIGATVLLTSLPSGNQRQTPATQQPAPSPQTSTAQTQPQPPPSVTPPAPEPPTPTPPAPPKTNTLADKNGTLAAMNAQMIASKSIIREEMGWNFKNKTLAGSNAGPIVVEGASRIGGTDKRRWLELDNATASLPLPQEANADTVTVRVFLKVDSPKDGPLLTIGPTRLGFSDGKLVMKTEDIVSATTIAASDFTKWSQIVLTKNKPNAGKYRSAIRLFINGKKATEVFDAELASQPVSPMVFPKLKGAVAGIKVMPKQWITPTVSTDHKRGMESFSPPAKPIAKTTPPTQATGAQLDKNYIWSFGSLGTNASENGKPLHIDGKSIIHGSTENIKFVSLYAGGSASVNLSAGTRADRFNLEFWFRPRDLEDRSILHFGDDQLRISKGRLALLAGKKLIAFPPLKFSKNAWHNVVLSKVIDNKNHSLLVGFRHGTKPTLIKLGIGNEPADLAPLRFHQIRADLGPVRLLKAGHQGLTESQHKNWQALRKNLEAASLPEPRPLTWPIEGKTLANLFQEKSSGPSLAGGKTARIYQDAERGTVALLPGGKSTSVALQLPQIPDNATGGSVSFWLKPGQGPGTILQIAGGQESVTLGVDPNGILKLITGSATDGTTKIQRNVWQHLAIGWNAGAIIVRLAGKQVCKQHTVKLGIGRKIAVIGSPRGNTLQCLVDDIQLFPCRVFPAPIASTFGNESTLAKIPESNQYRLVYDINLVNMGLKPNYDVDNTAKNNGPFDRIAYLLELESDKGKQYAYTSMDAFTDNIKEIGIPFEGTAIRHQTKVSNLNVYSNVKGVVAGTTLPGGNVEFWSGNYATGNSLKLTHASNKLYDFDDTFIAGDYGSMQIHNHQAKQTIFAINNWRNGPEGDLGIGNSPGEESLDWTFSKNAGSYKNKRLRIFVRPKK